MTKYIEKQDSIVKTRRDYNFVKPNRKGEILQVVINDSYDNSSSHSLPKLWRDAGKTKKRLKSYLTVQTYATDKTGLCQQKYNPTIKKETIKDNDGNIIISHFVINFDWLLEATDTNRQKIMDEITRLFYAN